MFLYSIKHNGLLLRPFFHVTTGHLLGVECGPDLCSQAQIKALGTHRVLKTMPVDAFDRQRNSMSDVEERFMKEDNEGQAHGEKNTTTQRPWGVIHIPDIRDVPMRTSPGEEKFVPTLTPSAMGNKLLGE